VPVCHELAVGDQVPDGLGIEHHVRVRLDVALDGRLLEHEQADARQA
jgi:hypothetical protein